jgi:hypothetical protein
MRYLALYLTLSLLLSGTHEVRAETLVLACKGPQTCNAYTPARNWNCMEKHESTEIYVVDFANATVTTKGMSINVKISDEDIEGKSTEEIAAGEFREDSVSINRRTGAFGWMIRFENIDTQFREIFFHQGICDKASDRRF